MSKTTARQKQFFMSKKWTSAWKQEECCCHSHGAEVNAVSGRTTARQEIFLLVVAPACRRSGEPTAQ